MRLLLFGVLRGAALRPEYMNFLRSHIHFLTHVYDHVVIRGLAVGTIDDSNTKAVLGREVIMGTALSLILGTAGCIRAAIFMTPFRETLAITTSLFMIVIISIILGALMPLGMKKLGIDPAHSSTTIQVVMDILGVSITVWVSSLVLDSGLLRGE
jgi:magnesium transporter